MITIERYRAGDRAAVESIFRQFHGAMAGAYLARWTWQYEQNPNLPDGLPLIWLVRLDGELIGQYATMPVTLQANGHEIDAAWGTDVLILPGHQRLGLGRLMFEAWDQGVGASIGLGLTDASHGLFRKLQWPDMGRVPRLVRRLSARKQDALTEPPPLRARMAATIQNARIGLTPVDGGIRTVNRFDDGVSTLWERVAAQFAFAVRRDAAYLNWKFVDAPHVTYQRAVIQKNGTTAGYVIIRHVEQDGWRATILADFLADPADPGALGALLHWVDREALNAQADVIRVSSAHARFNATLRSYGYENLSPSIRLVAKINAVPVPPTYYDSLDNWHVTVGDSDNDR
jgi:GNAT superfamily N-acetyltransferase